MIQIEGEEKKRKKREKRIDYTENVIAFSQQFMLP